MKIFSVFKNFFGNIKEEFDEIENLFIKEEITCINKFKEMVSSITLIESFEVIDDVLNLTIITEDEDDEEEVIQFSASLKEVELKDYYNKIVKEIINA